MKSPILGSAYVARSVNAADNRMVNLFPEIVPEGGKEPAFLNRAPGLRSFNTIGNGPVRGLWAFGGHLYAVSGQSLYRVDGPIETLTPGSWVNTPDDCGILSASSITGSGTITLTVTSDGLYQFTVGTETWPETPSPWSTILAGSPHTFALATLTFSESAPPVPAGFPDLTLERMAPVFDYTTGFWHYTYRLWHSGITEGSNHLLRRAGGWNMSDVYVATADDAANGYVDILRVDSIGGSVPDAEQLPVFGVMFSDTVPQYTETEASFTAPPVPVTVATPTIQSLTWSVDHWVQIYQVAIDPITLGNTVYLKTAGGYDPNPGTYATKTVDATDVTNGYVDIPVNIAPEATMSGLHAQYYFNHDPAYTVIYSGNCDPVTAPSSPIPDNPVTSGLVAEWKMLDGSGQTLTDSSGNAHDMTLGSDTGSDANDPTWVSEGLSFDGSNDWVVTTTSVSPFANLTDYHIVAVVLPSDLSTDRGIFGSINQYRLQVSASKLEIGAYAGASPTWTTLNTPTLGVDTWYFTEGWRDTAASGLCGVRLGNSTSATSAIGSSAPSSGGGSVYIGHTDNGNTYWDGKIAYVAFYDRKLSDSEATQVYNYVKDLLALRGITGL